MRFGKLSDKQSTLNFLSLYTSSLHDSYSLRKKIVAKILATLQYLATNIKICGVSSKKFVLLSVLFLAYSSFVVHEYHGYFAF